MKKSGCVRAVLAMLVAVIFAWALPEVKAGGIESGVGEDYDGYRPGKTNPVKNPGRLYLLRDDYLCTLFGDLGGHTLTKKLAIGSRFKGCNQ